jgi:hypothetical protein
MNSLGSRRIPSEECGMSGGVGCRGYCEFLKKLTMHFLTSSRFGVHLPWSRGADFASLAMSLTFYSINSCERFRSDDITPR